MYSLPRKRTGPDTMGEWWSASSGNMTAMLLRTVFRTFWANHRQISVVEDQVISVGVALILLDRIGMRMGVAGKRIMEDSIMEGGIPRDTLGGDPQQDTCEIASELWITSSAIDIPLPVTPRAGIITTLIAVMARM